MSDESFRVDQIYFGNNKIEFEEVQSNPKTSRYKLLDSLLEISTERQDQTGRQALLGKGKVRRSEMTGAFTAAEDGRAGINRPTGDPKATGGCSRTWPASPNALR